MSSDLSHKRCSGEPARLRELSHHLEWRHVKVSEAAEKKEERDSRATPGVSPVTELGCAS